MRYNLLDRIDSYNNLLSEKLFRTLNYRLKYIISENDKSRHVGKCIIHSKLNNNAKPLGFLLGTLVQFDIYEVIF